MGKNLASWGLPEDQCSALFAKASDTVDVEANKVIAINDL